MTFIPLLLLIMGPFPKHLSYRRSDFPQCAWKYVGEQYSPLATYEDQQAYVQLFQVMKNEMHPILQ